MGVQPNCQLCGISDQSYLKKYGGYGFSCGHCICWFCSTQHCSKCLEYQVIKGYLDGRLENNWSIKQEGCVICNSVITLPCGTKYADYGNITPSQ